MTMFFLEVVKRTPLYAGVILAVLMLNFLLKYVLHMAISMAPGVYDTRSFDLFYFAVCGFLVGIPMGGIHQAYGATLAWKGRIPQ